jgi:hypothetical protein
VAWYHYLGISGDPLILQCLPTSPQGLQYHIDSEMLYQTRGFCKTNIFHIIR